MQRRNRCLNTHLILFKSEFLHLSIYGEYLFKSYTNSGVIPSFSLQLEQGLKMKFWHYSYPYLVY